MMTRAEFLLVISWLYLAPLVAGAVVVLACAAYQRRLRWGNVLAALGLMVVLTFPIGVGLFWVVPHGWRVRDSPILWAPFWAIAVALALPVACRRMAR